MVDKADAVAAGIRAARALSESHNHRGAVAALQRVLGQDPNHVEGHYLLGLCLHNLGRHAEAVAACSAAVALDPENAIAHRLLGVALGGSAATKAKALDHLDEAVRLKSEDPYNHLHRAWVLACLRRPQEAQAAYEAACERAPTDARVLAGAASFFFTLRQARRASDLAARAFAAAPDDHVALSIEARSRLLQGRTADARDLARAAIAILPTHHRAVSVMVEAEMRSNPVYAAWSRLKNWGSGARWRRAVLLLAAIQIVSGVVGTAATAAPDQPWVAISTFAICLIVPAWPGIVYRRRVAAGTRPTRLRKGF